MHNSYYPTESLDAFEVEALEHGEVESFETGTEDAVFGETDEMALAADLLEVADEASLDQFIGDLVARAAGRLPSAVPLRTMLRQAAVRALPMVGGASGSHPATEAGELFGLELEGLSPEDQEFELARRFVRFAGAGARQAARFRSGLPPAAAAQRALTAAARRYAPGFLRPPRRRPWPRRGSAGIPPADQAPTPIAVTCHCGGAGLAAAAEPAPAPAGDAPSSPDTEPASSTEPPPSTSNEIPMHDLDHTTMELSDEADFELESPETQDEYDSEGFFTEEEEAELAGQLLEISDEAELDQFLGGVFKKARRFFGSALKNPMLQPLGGYLKGAIKKALPVAGAALGNVFVPGLGGQIGSRLAAGAGDLLGLEFEGVEQEDQEMEVARHLVRMAGNAVQDAAQAGEVPDPRAAAKAAVVSAAQTHVPGLLRPPGAGYGYGARRRPQSGRWYRRGGRIILVGV